MQCHIEISTHLLIQFLDQSLPGRILGWKTVGEPVGVGRSVPSTARAKGRRVFFHMEMERHP